MLSLINKITGNKLKVGKNIGWLLADQIIRYVIGFVISIYFVRKFTVEEYGAYNYSFAFITFFSAIAGLGLEQILTKYFVEHSEEKEKILGTSLVMRLLSSLISLFISYAIIRFVRPNDPFIYNLVFAFSISYISQSFYVFDSWFQSQIQSKYSIIAKSIPLFVVTLLKLFLLFKTNASILSFAYVYSIEFLLSALLLWMTIKRNTKLKQLSFDLQLAKKFLKDSWPLILSGLSTYLYMRLNQILIGNILGDKEVGIFSLSVMISEVWYCIPAIICSSVFPILIESKKRSEDTYMKRLNKLYIAFIWITIFVALFVTIFSKDLLVWVFGTRYINSYVPLSILIWSGTPVFLGVATNLYLIIEKKTTIIFVRTVIGAAVSVLLNTLLIKRFGIIGASIASFVSYSVVTYSMFFFPNLSTGNKILLASFNPISSIRTIFNLDK